MVSGGADAIGMLGPNELINGVGLLLGAHRGTGEHRHGALIHGPSDFVTRSRIVIEWPGGPRSWQRDKLKAQAAQSKGTKQTSSS